jgi:transcriptional regulator with XRE-family HTH domain
MFISQQTTSPYKIIGWEKRLLSRYNQLKKKGEITQKIIGENMGVAPTMISLLIRGKRRPNVSQFELLSKSLKIPLIWILFGVMPEEASPLSKEEAILLRSYRICSEDTRAAISAIAKLALEKIEQEEKNKFKKTGT